MSTALQHLKPHATEPLILPLFPHTAPHYARGRPTAMWRRRGVHVARALGAAYAAAELTAFVGHQKRISEIERAPKRTMDFNAFDVDAHALWFARELRREPNPRRLFEEVFNDRALETIPRNRALAMLEFYLSAREASEHASGTHPRGIRRAAESLLRDLERRHGLKFARDCPVWPARVGDATLAEEVEADERMAKERGASWGSWFLRFFGYRESRIHSPVEGTPDFIRTNTHNITAWYKPLLLQLMIWRYRAKSEETLRRSGFKEYKDEDTDVKLWVRIPETCAHDTVLFFLHGFGMGVPPYTSFIEKLPKDRIVVVPEWPNISYGLDRSHEYPTPRQLANVLAQTVERVQDEKSLLYPQVEEADAQPWYRERFGGWFRKTPSKGELNKCDVIAHSYGTVVLTGFRRHYPDMVRRCVYIDPVCFLPAFGSYLKYAYDDHLLAWQHLTHYISNKLANPEEPMDLFNILLSSWFIKGDVSTQQLMKRLLFPHEAWERGPMSSEDLIVLSGLDEIVASKEVEARLRVAWPTVRMIHEKQWQHGGFLLEPDPHDVVPLILKFVSKV